MTERQRRRAARGGEPPPPPRAERTAGVLLHPTSLPGRFPVGDLGPAAHAFLDWLTEAGLARWQVLPLGPTGFGDSPYTGLSAFAGNPLLISPERLVADGLLDSSDLVTAPPNGDFVDFAAARDLKERLHRKGWERFRTHAPSALAEPWRAFRDGDWPRAFELFAREVAPPPAPAPAGAESEEADAAANPSAPTPEPSLLQQNAFASVGPIEKAWLDEWTLFAALKDAHGGRAWVDWDEELRLRRPAAMARARRELAGEIELRAFEQFLFCRQWTALQAAAGARGIELLGDLPIYVALDSADVWAHRELFALDEQGRPRAVAGVPPDYFSPTGQLWGNPLYRWRRLAARGYDWWVDRVRWQLRLTPRLRLDHFRGFVAFWRVPAGEPTAEHGRWVRGPGARLFRCLEGALGGLPLVAEDLGDIDEPVHALRRRLGLPGMRVLQFGFGEHDSLHAPHRHEPSSVVYTGTHDNDTSRGWFAAADEGTRARVLTYLGTAADEVPWALVRAAYTSVADLAIVPLQDLLGLGGEARSNTPGREAGNWAWRVRGDAVPADLPARLRALGEAAARRPPQPPG